MPFYTFTCPDGHSTDHRCLMAEKPETLACGACGSEARDRGVYAVRTTLPEGHGVLGDGPGRGEIRERGGQSHDIRSVDLECAACSVRWFAVYDATKEEPDPCPTCGQAGRVRIGAPGAEAPGSYPRYDRGLGLVLESEAHRRRVCRERGLTPVDGDFDEDRIMGRIEDDANAELHAADDYFDRLENSPEFRDYRILRDKGRYDSVLQRQPPTSAINVPMKVPLKKRRVIG